MHRTESGFILYEIYSTGRRTNIPYVEHSNTMNWSAFLDIYIERDSNASLLRFTKITLTVACCLREREGDFLGKHGKLLQLA